MNHDHRCPALRYAVLGGRVCVCGIVEDIRNDTLAAAVQRVEALRFGSEEMYEVAEMYHAAIAAIKGEKG